MANSKLSAFFSLLLVFISGAVVGVVGYRVYNTSVAPQPRPFDRKMPDPAEVKRQLIDEMKHEVRLDDQQVKQLEQIYESTRERFDDLNKKRNVDAHAIWDDQINQIKQMLRPEQVPLYEKLRARKEAEREEERKRRAARKGGLPGDIRKDH